MQAVNTDGNNSNLGDFQNYNRTELQDIWVLWNSHKIVEPRRVREMVIYGWRKLAHLLPRG